MVEMVGRRFGRVVAQRFLFRINKRDKWECLCDCGKTKEIWGSNLRSGRSLSCGCLQKERASATRGRHRRSGTGIYRSWASMRMRCTNPNNSDFKHYGGRGIECCQRWLDSFDAFLEDMGDSWAPGLSIERIDNNGNYEPGNCRWATIQEQRRNTRNTVLIDTPWGRMHIMDAAINAGLTEPTLRARVNLWPQERWFDPPGARLKRRQ